MRRQHRCWSAALGTALVLLILGVAAGPAAAGVRPRDHGPHHRRIAVGDIRVAPGETVDGPLVGVDGDTRIAGRVDGDAAVIRGDLRVTVDGEVDGDVIVLRGDARIDGLVRGDVVVLGGRAVVGASAVVRGDVSSTDSPRVAGAARVTGDVKHIDVPGMLAALGTGLLLFWWLAVTVSTAFLAVLLLALVPRGLEAAAAVGRGRTTWWVALLVGAGLVVGLPILAIAAMGSLVGLPFGLGVLGALGFVHALGYIAGAFFLGRCILKTPQNRFGAFFVGWAILRVVAFLPLLGMLVWLVAATYGVGMLAIAAFRAGQVPPPLAPDATSTPAPSPAEVTP